MVCFASSTTGVVASGRGEVKKRAVLNCTAVCCTMVSRSPQLSSCNKNGKTGIIIYLKLRLLFL